MKLLLSALASVCLSSSIPDNAVSIPHEAEITGNDLCEGEQVGSEYIATFKADLFVHNTVLTIPKGASAADFIDVEVAMDRPSSSPGRPIRCGKKFNKGMAKKLKSSDIMFYCRGQGKTKLLGRESSGAKVYIKKKQKKNAGPRCIDFSGVQFNTVQEDLEVFSDWSDWSECEDNQVSRSRTCTGIFCDQETETETKTQICVRALECDPGFAPNADLTDCHDIDECNPNQCDDGYTCVNTHGSYGCSLYSEWSEWSECADNKSSRSRTCEGDFCDNHLTEERHEACKLEGCEDGFELSDDETRCEDIDECNPSQCPEGYECENTEGSFKCKVYSQWSDWSECVDDQVSRNRTCEGDCDSEEEIETRNEDCLICDEGYEANEDDTECVDIDECALGHCPENSDCTNSEGSYSCQCHEGMFGDDMNFCIVPRGCHGGEGDCTCQTLINPNVTTLRTSWSSEDDTNCKIEYFLDLPLEPVEVKVNSWKMILNFANPAKIVDIWRARTSMDTFSAEHEFSAMYFNVEDIMSMTLHAAFEQSCDSLKDVEPEITLCTEEAIVTTTSTTTTTTAAPTPAATEAATEAAVTEPALVLTDEVCEKFEVGIGSSWENAEGTKVTQSQWILKGGVGAHEWRVETPFGEDTNMQTWNFATSLSDFWVFTAQEYNQVLYGDTTITVLIEGDIEEQPQALFCYKNDVATL